MYILYFILHVLILTLKPCLSDTVPLELAFGKPAEQSSTYLLHGPEYVVDDNNGTNLILDNCAHTGDGDTNPWWMVDMQAVYSIKSVRIFNRGMDEYGTGKRTEE